MNYRFFHFEPKDHIVTLTVNHPPSNLLTSSLLTELDQILSQLESDSSYKVVIFASTGRFFCLGADVRELQHLETTQKGKDFAIRGQRLLDRLENLDRPVIAAIQGACLGGGLELVMACHIRLAAQEATFGLPEIKLGLIPGFGGSQRLPRIIGASKAAEVMLTGRVVSAEEALTTGLISEVQPASDLMSRVRSLAEVIRGKGGLAVRAALRAIRSTSNAVPKTDFLREAELFGELCETRDAKEGIQAFIEKRSPRFQDQ